RAAVLPYTTLFRSRAGGGGEAHDEAGAPRAVGDAERAPVDLGDLPGDGQAEPGALRVAGPRLRQPGEPLEDPFPRVLRHAGAVVQYLQDGVVPVAQDDHLDARLRVPFGVAQQVAQHPGQPDAVGADGHARLQPRLDADARLAAPDLPAG